MGSGFWKSPVTLIAHGRSGTSLIQNIFDAHPRVAVAGETADIIFGTWYSVRKAKGIVPGLVEDGKLVDWDLRAGRGVRACFAGIFDFDADYWMQKPIGQPFVYGQLREQSVAEQDWFTSYWKILRTSFPDGKFITILRDPRDVVLSSMEYWGQDEQSVWLALATMARCLLHEDSLVTAALVFDRLVEEPEEETRALFDHVGIPYDPCVLRGFDHVYVPDRTDWKQERSQHADRVARGFSREAQWSALHLDMVSDSTRRDIKAVWKKFAVDLEL